jgi:hypothetical protein
MERNLAWYGPSRVIMYHLDGYNEWTAESRGRVATLCENAGATCGAHELSVDDPAANWDTIARTTAAVGAAGGEVVIDLTTMPREIIWTVLWFCQYNGGKIAYVYHRPDHYSREWLSKDPQKPRLVYKLSGSPRLGLKTALVVLAGYDVERAVQLMAHFEPSLMLLGLQTTKGDSDNERRMGAHADRFSGNASVRLFAVDAYAADHGEKAIWEAVVPHVQAHNVIMSSLGPKPSAIALYRLHRANPSLGLAYAPSREFNREYSQGIADAIQGAL